MLTPAWNRALEANCAKLLLRPWPSTVISQVLARSRCNPHHTLQPTVSDAVMKTCQVSRVHTSPAENLSGSFFLHQIAVKNVTSKLIPIPIFSIVRSVWLPTYLCQTLLSLSCVAVCGPRHCCHAWQAVRCIWLYTYTCIICLYRWADVLTILKERLLLLLLLLLLLPKLPPLYLLLNFIDRPFFFRGGGLATADSHSMCGVSRRSSSSSCLFVKRTIQQKQCIDNSRQDKSGNEALSVSTFFNCTNSCSNHITATVPTCKSAVEEFEVRRIQELEAKRDLRKSGPPSTSNFECQICHRMCRSRIGLLAHKSHSWWWDPSYRRLSPWWFRVFLWHNGISYFLKHMVACGYQKWISLHNHTQSQWSICIEPLTKLDSGYT